MSASVSVRAPSRESIVRAWLECLGGSGVAVVTEVAQLAGVEEGVVRRVAVGGRGGGRVRRAATVDIRSREI